MNTFIHSHAGIRTIFLTEAGHLLMFEEWPDSGISGSRVTKISKEAWPDNPAAAKAAFHRGEVTWVWHEATYTVRPGDPWYEEIHKAAQAIAPGVKGDTIKILTAEDVRASLGKLKEVKDR